MSTAAFSSHAGGACRTPRISDSHLGDLRKSGLGDEQIAVAGLYTETDPTSVANLLGWDKPAKTLGPCLVFPYFDAASAPTGYCRLKPSRPRRDRKSGKSVKYEGPKGRPNRAFFPPKTRSVLDDPSVDLIITEGEKKSLKADQEGFPCIGIPGVYAWQTKRRRDPDGKGDGERHLIPDLKSIRWKGRRVYIVFDSDAALNTNVTWAEYHLARALSALGADVRIVSLPSGPDGPDGLPGKVGLDDFLVAHGPDRLRELIDAATPPVRPAPAGDGRQRVELGTDEHRVNAEVAAELADDPALYQRGGELVRVCVDPLTSPRIEPVPPAALRDVISRRVAFVKVVETDKGPVEKPHHPPAWCVNAVAAFGSWPGVRPLAGVISFPVLRPDGSVLDTPGYDPATSLFLHWPGEPLPVPAGPTAAGARAAAAELLDVVADFPFEHDLHKAAWLAALLTPLARAAFAGPAPLFLVDGNTRGCGKGLLLDVVSRLVTGRPFAVVSYPGRGEYGGNEEELRKKLTTVLMYGDRLVLFDNLTGSFGDGCIDRALTGTEWQDRILGGNRQFRGPLSVTFYATGNNVAVGADTARRVCHVRLETPHERPEDRSDFKRPRLLEWVAANRPRLLAAGLAILRAYFLAGRPDQDLKPWGSFEAWSGLVRNALVWAGQPDPGESRLRLQGQADETARGLGQLINVLQMVDPDHIGLTAAEIVKRADGQVTVCSPEVREMLAEAVGALVAKPDSRKLGTRLRHLRRRVVGGRFLDLAGVAAGVNRWVVVDAATGWGRRGSAPPPTAAGTDMTDVKDVTGCPGESDTATAAPGDAGAIGTGPQPCPSRPSCPSPHKDMTDVTDVRRVVSESGDGVVEERL